MNTVIQVLYGIVAIEDYWRRCIHILNRHGGSNLSPLCLFIETMPIKKAVASGNGNDFLHKNCTFKLQINLDATIPD
jgi:hypothetical protein